MSWQEELSERNYRNKMGFITNIVISDIREFDSRGMNIRGCLIFFSGCTFTIAAIVFLVKLSFIMLSITGVIGILLFVLFYKYCKTYDSVERSKHTIESNANITVESNLAINTLIEAYLLPKDTVSILGNINRGDNIIDEIGEQVVVIRSGGITDIFLYIEDEIYRAITYKCNISDKNLPDAYLIVVLYANPLALNSALHICCKYKRYGLGTSLEGNIVDNSEIVVGPSKPIVVEKVRDASYWENW